MLLAGAWLTAIVSVVLAYVIAGEIWKRKHSMYFGRSEKKLRLSGVYGEIFVVSAAALVLFLIDRVSGEVSLESVVMANPLVSAILFAIAVAGVYIHGTLVAVTAVPGEKQQLFFTYLVYGIYSTIVFAGLFAIAALMVMEAVADANVFAARSEVIVAQVEALNGLGYTEAISGLNMAYIDLLGVLKGLENSMSPVFVFAAALFGFNLLIRYTPLRAVFVDNAVRITYATTFTALALVLITGIWIYTGQYSVFIQQVLDAMAVLKPTFAAAPEDESSRFADIWMYLIDEQALLGFLSRMSDEWGGVAALLGAIQWGAERFSAPESERASD